MERARIQERVFWDNLKRTAVMHANTFGLKYDYAEDCAQDFITKKLRELINPLRCADSEQAMARLERQSHRHARERAFRLRHTRSKKVSLEELQQRSVKVNRVVAALIDPSPGPEELLIQAEFLVRYLDAIDGLTPQQQALWTRYALDGVNSAALVLELGRSDDALRQAICRIRKRIACLMAGVGMEAAEIADYRSLLGMYRSVH
jgi:DNA-directed RNA polymerase specialized sigma24 family protein